MKIQWEEKYISNRKEMSGWDEWIEDWAGMKEINDCIR